MNDINKTIDELVAVGNKYLQDHPKGAFNLFHHNQPAAKKLVGLGTDAKDLDDAAKLTLVKKTIGDIYHKDFRDSGLSALLQSIHKIIMQADENFSPYQDKYNHMQKGHPKAILSLVDFRSAADALTTKENTNEKGM